MEMTSQEIGIAIPCNGYDFVLAACDGRSLNQIVPWEGKNQLKYNREDFNL